MNTQIRWMLAVVLCLQVNSLHAQRLSLAEVTVNNTSASPGFGGSIDPRPGILTPMFNSAPGNVSKQDPHLLVGPGFKGKIFVDLMPWFSTHFLCSVTNAGIGGWGPERRICNKAHIDIGYDSNDLQEIHRQMDDIASRHFDGVVITLSYPSRENNASVMKNIFADLNARCSNGVCPLQAVIMPDNIQCGSVAADKAVDECNLHNLEDTVCYLDENYFDQPSYLRNHGRPIWQPFFNEGWLQRASWTKLHQFSENLGKNCVSLKNEGALPTNNVPLQELIGSVGLSYYPDADGAYFWLAPSKGASSQSQAVQRSMSLLQGFYRSALLSQSAGRYDWGAVYAKFNNILAGWAPALKPGSSPAEGGEVMDADCGRTWIRTFDLARQFLNGRAAPFLQVETWNDYDEGTEIESGIDNCVAGMTTSVKGNNLTWEVNFSTRPDGSSGDDSTIDHFAIYTSTTKIDLTLAGTVADGVQQPVRSIPLASLHLNGSNGYLYVQAVGKSSILNHITSQPATYNSH